MRKILNILSVLVLLTILFASCQKDSFSKPIPATVTLQPLSDTTFFGKALTVGILTTPDIKEIQLNVISVASSQSVYQDTIKNDSGKYVLSQDITVPADGSWSGNFVVQIKALNSSATVKSDTVYFKKGVPVYYLVGGSASPGWDPTQGIKFSAQSIGGKTIYELYGYYTLDGSGLKVLPTNINWDGGFGISATVPGLLSTAGDAANIPVPADGFYRLRIDMTDLTAPTYTLVNSNWGIIGDATAGGWDASTDMTVSATKGNYECTIIATLTSGGSFKFRENNAWDVNLGEDTGSNLKYDGDNIAVATSGTYLIKLELTPTGYTYSIAKQ